MSSLGWTQGLIRGRGQKRPTTDVDVAADVDVAVDVAAAEKIRKEWIKKCKEERKKEWMATRAKTRAENKQKRAKESTSVLAPVSTHALLLAPPLEPLALLLAPAEAPATTGLELLANLASNRESTVLLEQTRAQTPPVVFVPLDTPCDLAQSPGLHITWKGWNNGGYILGMYYC